jgi:hypothetical protein
MEVIITWHNDQFNVELASRPGAEAFLSVKGCRIVDGTKGPFVSYPATKNTTTGKWWSHCWGSDAFNAVVLSKAQASMPSKAPARRQAAPAGGGGADMDEIPFADPLKGCKSLAL